MLTVAVVGFGGMGRGRLGYYAQIPDGRVEAIVDVRGDALRRDLLPSSELEIDPSELRWYCDWRDLARDGQIDIADICLPTPFHRNASVDLVRAGIHVLCEKPMALSLADCDAMIGASRESGRHLMVAHCVRFWPEYTYLSDLVHSGDAGDLLSLRLERSGPLPRGGQGWMC